MDPNGASPEFTAHIIDRLIRTDDRDDIIMEVCKAQNLDWEKAERWVKDIQEENKVEIVKRQFPFMTAVAIFTFLGGLLLLGYGVYVFIMLLVGKSSFPEDMTSYFLPMIEKGTNPISAIKPAFYAYVSFFLSFLISPFSALIFGAAMLFGSLGGMRNVWAEVLSNHRDI